MKQDFMIGAVSKNPFHSSLESRYIMIEESVRANTEVDLLCFGELFLVNDPNYFNSIENEEKFQKIMARIHTLAVRYQVAISYGYILKENNKYYIAQKIVFPDKREYIYRKVHLGVNEKKIYQQGDKIDVFSYKGYIFGVQICIDTHIMEMSILQKLMGAEIIIAPFNTPYDSEKRLKNWSKYIPARAYETNMCFVCNNSSGGLQIVNGYGDVVKENADINCIETYNISFDKDFNKKINYFSYRKADLYKKIIHKE